MKKLRKITISPEKVMKNEDLINLKGGYSPGDYLGWCCECIGHGFMGGVDTILQCRQYCWAAWGVGPTAWWCS